MIQESCAGGRLAVVGATGLLGWALVHEALARYQVWGLARHPELVAGSCQTEAVDVLDGGSLDRLLERIAPDVVIHCAALTSVDLCEREPGMAEAINVQGTRNVLRAIGGHSCKFVLISTDAVFDGVRGEYTETDTPAPVNVYGRTKLEAEEVTLAARPDALVVRTAFYGWNILPKESLGEWMVNRLRAGREVPGFRDVRFSPLVAHQLARLLLDLASTPAAGCLHLGSSEGCSKYEFARRLAITFGCPPQLVVPVMSEAAGLVAPRPKDVTLSVSRAAGLLSRPLPGISEGLSEFLQSEPALRGHARFPVTGEGSAV